MLTKEEAQAILTEEFNRLRKQIEIQLAATGNECYSRLIAKLSDNAA